MAFRFSVAVTSAAFTTAVLSLTVPALAQKSADTLRFAFQDAIQTADAVADPKPETRITTQAVFDSLVWYDPMSGEYKPALAESWTRHDDRTIDFKLRRDVKWHDGSAFTADDVVYSYNWQIDPASKVRYPTIDFVDHAEKLDQFTVRVVEKQPTSSDLSDMGQTPIFPAAIHGKLADKSEFGRKTPIGTGPFKVESVDSAKGIVLVRNPDYVMASPWRPAAGVKRMLLLPIPDIQTEIALLMTGGIDVMRDVPKDQAESLAANPNLEITASGGPVYFYMAMDSVNRSGNEALSKLKVRKAIEMAVDRDALAKNVVSGGAAVKIINALCTERQSECPKALTVTPPATNLVEAKKLLAEAGYPDGFDVEVGGITGAKEVAEAVAGQLRQIGIRARMSFRGISPYREAESTGKLQISVGHFWGAGAAPVAPLTKFFGAPARDYWRDTTIQQLVRDSNSEMDQPKRDELYRRLFDRINEQAYIMPLTTFPGIFAHGKDVVIGTGAMNSASVDLDRITWKE
jgi:peptide/nickel transport system substrate-binding protein